MGTIRKAWTDEQDAVLQKYYNTQGMNYCAEKLERNNNSIMHRAQRLGLKKRGRIKRPVITLSGGGYYEIKGNSEDYFIHRLVAEFKLGRLLTSADVVHHIDGDKLNNHPDNLEVLTRSEHMKIHAQERWDCVKTLS